MFLGANSCALSVCFIPELYYEAKIDADSYLMCLMPFIIWVSGHFHALTWLDVESCFCMMLMHCISWLQYIHLSSSSRLQPWVPWKYVYDDYASISCKLLIKRSFLWFPCYSEYRTVSGVAGPLVILENVKVNIFSLNS